MKKIKEVETQSENSTDIVANYYFVCFLVYGNECVRHTSRGVCINSSSILEKIPVGSITSYLCKKYKTLIGVEFVTPIEKRQYEILDVIYQGFSELMEKQKIEKQEIPSL